MLGMIGFDIVFRHPEYLWAIAPAVFVCAALLALGFAAAQRAWRSNPFLRLHGLNMAPRVRTYVLRWVVISVLLALLIAVWAEPENRQIVKEPVYGGIRIALLPDVSFSMRWAQDVPPFPDRLVAAKSVMSGLGDMTRKDPDLKGSYQLAIIPFAGEAVTYLPFSASVSEFTEAVDSIDETTINNAGTNLLQPILEYERLLKSEAKYKQVDPHTLDIAVIISDGGKGEGVHKDLPQIKAARLRMQGKEFFTVGIGSAEKFELPDGRESRRTIPVQLKKYDSTGAFVDYVREDPKNPRSAIMTSELDERTLISVAGDESHYFFYEGKDRLLAQLKESIIKHRVLKDTISHESLTPVAHWFLIPAFLIAMFAFGYAQRLFFFALRPFQGLMRKYRQAA